jgi:hypothetical protein
MLGACASNSQPIAEPVVVHTDENARVLLATNPYKAMNVKIGARWFPRCQQFATLGSRTDVQTACMTDEQIREIAEKSNSQQQEFLQRSSGVVGLQGS